MKEVRLNSLVILILLPIIALFANNVPKSWTDGPLNHDVTNAFFDEKNMIPNTLYHNNATDYYTVWYDETQSYVTYDRRTNIAMDTVVFNVPEANGKIDRKGVVYGWNNVTNKNNGGGQVVIVDGKVAPTSHFDEEGMRIQEEYGCIGCHNV